MAELYRVACSRCHGSDCDQTLGPGSAAGVTTDGKHAGVVTQGSYRMVLDRHETWVPLAHPQELPMLLATGHVGLSASLTGRLAYAEEVICTRCGSLWTRADLTVFAPGLGCLAILLAPVLFLTLPSHMDRGIWAGVGGTLVTVVLMHWVGPRLLRQVFRRGRGLLPRGPCPSCGSSQAIAVAAAPKKMLPCPTCGEQSVSVTVAGVT
jgi:hypothetical protein